MTDPDRTPSPDAITPPETAGPPPASETMAQKLTVNRTGKLTGPQYRLAFLVGFGALVVLLCPTAMLIQMAALLLLDEAPAPTVGGVIFTVLGAGFFVLLLGLIGSNAYTFLLEAFMRQPVKVVRGPLTVHVTDGDRPELPFSYIVGDYSFAPYVAPRDLPMRTGAPYIVYYGARSRLLLSMAALDAPDAAQWEPEF